MKYALTYVYFAVHVYIKTSNEHISSNSNPLCGQPQRFWNLKHLAAVVAEKGTSSMVWVGFSVARASIELVCSAITCVRGARSSLGYPVCSTAHWSLDQLTRANIARATSAVLKCTCISRQMLRDRCVDALVPQLDKRTCHELNEAWCISQQMNVLSVLLTISLHNYTDIQLFH